MSFEIGDLGKVNKPYQGKESDDCEFQKGQLLNIISFPDKENIVRASPVDKPEKKGPIPVSHLIKITEKEKDKLLKEEKKEQQKKEKEGKLKEEKERKEQQKKEKEEKIKEEKERKEEKKKKLTEEGRKSRGTLFSKFFNSSSGRSSDTEMALDQIRRTSLGDEETSFSPVTVTEEKPISRTLRPRKSVFWKNKNAPAVFKNFGDPDDMEDKFLSRPSRESIVKKGILKEDEGIVKKLFKKGGFFNNLQDVGWEENKDMVVPTNQVFGKPLAPLVKKDNKYVIPQHVLDIIRDIDRSGVKEEGIFRLSGGTAEINRLKEAIGSGQIIDLKTLGRHTLGSVLKQYFRELPEPLCTFALYTKFMHSNNIVKLRPKVESLAEAIRALPLENFIVFAYMIVYLGTVTTHGHRNKMDANNLGVVFGPTLISCSESDPNFDPFEQMRTCEPIRLAIEARDALFPNLKLEQTEYTLEEVEKLRNIQLPDEIVLAEPPPEPTTGIKIPSTTESLSHSNIGKLASSGKGALKPVESKKTSAENFVEKQDSVNQEDTKKILEKKDSLKKEDSEKKPLEKKDSLQKEDPEKRPLEKKDSLKKEDSEKRPLEKKDSLKKEDSEKKPLEKKDSLQKEDPEKRPLEKKDSLKKEDSEKRPLEKKDSLKKEDSEKRPLEKKDSLKKEDSEKKPLEKKDSLKKEDSELEKKDDSKKDKKMKPEKKEKKTKSDKKDKKSKPDKKDKKN